MKLTINITMTGSTFAPFHPADPDNPYTDESRTVGAIAILETVINRLNDYGVAACDDLILRDENGNRCGTVSVTE